MQENDIELWWHMQFVSKVGVIPAMIKRIAFFSENTAIAIWKVALGPTDIDQKQLTDSESLSFNKEATCLLLSSPRTSL